MQPTLPLAETVAREVRAEMGRQQQSANALALKLGVSDMYLSRRLRGEVPFDLRDLEKVAKALGTSIKKLMPTSSVAV